MSIRESLWLSLMLLFVWSCQNDRKSEVPAFKDRGSLPVLVTHDVNSLISDSGIIQYKLIAKTWEIYDKASEPYWYFPDKIYVEKFDSTFHASATIAADKAYYYSNKRLWKLIGNVKVVNLEQMEFYSELLYWDQYAQKVYTDSAIMIVQPDRTVYGKGFESNERMTQWIIPEAHGPMNINE